MATASQMPERPGPAGNPEDLVGPEPAPSSENTQQKQNQALANLVKSIHTDLENIARQYPAMQSAAKEAKKALTDGMVKAMSQMPGSGESMNAPKVAG